MEKVIEKICNFLSAVILVCIFAIIGVLLVPKVMGYETFAVLSGSMEPYYHVGSVVYVDKGVDPADIQVGDPITFRLGGETVATHRVVEIDSEAQAFVTKGDANEAIDAAPIPFENLIGRAKFSIPLLGYISLYMKTKKGLFGIAAVFIVFILLQIIPEIFKEDESEQKEKGGEKGDK